MNTRTTYSLCVALLGMLLLTAATTRASVIYIDAEGGVGGNTVNASDGNQTNWFANPRVDGDDLWGYRSGSWGVAEGDVFASNSDDAPLLRTLITGLDADADYHVYLYFGSNFEDWRIKGGLNDASLSTYSWLDSGVVETMPEEGGITQYRAHLGVAQADGSGNIDVFVDDLGTLRTWYDGVGYESTAVPEPTTLSLIILGGLSALLCRRRQGWMRLQSSNWGAQI